MFQSYDVKTDKSYGTKHVPLLRAEMQDMGLDAFVIPHSDEYQNEYLPACGERLKWITGFSGSAGSAIVATGKAVVFVDGRYTIQVRSQVDGEIFDFCHLVTEPPHEWIAKNISSGSKVGYDPWLHTIDGVKTLMSACAKAGAELVPCATNPLDACWKERPDKPLADIIPHPLEFSGTTSEEKRQQIGKIIGERGSDAVVIATPASIAWVLNIRGGDVSHTPLPLSRVVVNSDGAADFYVDKRKLTNGLAAHLGNAVTIYEEDDLSRGLEDLGKANKTVEVDPQGAPAWVFEQLTNAGAKIVRKGDPCVLPKAMKNSTERDGARSAHIRDGSAMVKFLCWLENAAPKGGIDEITAAKKLESFRTEDVNLRDISFTTISASGPNAAFPHYSVDTTSNRPLEKGVIYLVDSGGQYPNGTTDITRTVIVGEPSAEMKDRFTRVLKGHIGLSACRFPEGTAGAQLDVLARHALWQAGLNYDHGTGHGVGSYLGVHEGPHNISGHPKAMEAPLKEGMIVSNEPGYYKEGHYGIRIENLIMVTAPEAIDGGDRPMHRFETLTLCPIDLNLVDKEIMSKSEIEWLNAYHAQVLDVIGQLVDDETKAWLESATRAI
jgi:Xaa-Pro aminopeptidase